MSGVESKQVKEKNPCPTFRRSLTGCIDKSKIDLKNLKIERGEDGFITSVTVAYLDRNDDIQGEKIDIDVPGITRVYARPTKAKNGLGYSVKLTTSKKK